MAARLRQHHQDDVRRKIQASALINRLQSYIDGDVDLTAGQVQAIKILLDKSVSNAPAATEISGPDGGPIAHSLEVKFVNAASGVAEQAASAVPAEPV